MTGSVRVSDLMFCGTNYERVTAETGRAHQGDSGTECSNALPCSSYGSTSPAKSADSRKYRAIMPRPCLGRSVFADCESCSFVCSVGMCKGRNSDLI